jgi:nucleotide-binding universal stress UspA family protein
MRLYRRILVPVDGSPTSDKALAAALNMARNGGGHVRLVHVLNELTYLASFEAATEVYPSARRAADRVLASSADAARAADVEPETALIDTPGQSLGDAVAREATNWSADVIAVGTHGRRGVGRALLGSGAEQIIRTAPVPVLVVRTGDDQE